MVEMKLWRHMVEMKSVTSYGDMVEMKLWHHMVEMKLWNSWRHFLHSFLNLIKQSTLVKTAKIMNPYL